MPALAPMTITGLAEKTGVDVESIRSFERLGFIARPRRSPGGYMLYRGEDVDILIFASRARRLGFSLDAIGELLDLATPRNRRSCGEVYDIASRQLAEIRARIEELTRMERTLAALTDSCPRAGNAAHCPIVTTLAQAD